MNQPPEMTDYEYAKQKQILMETQSKAQAQAQMQAAQWQQGMTGAGQLGIGRPLSQYGNQTAAPNEPTMLGRATELLNHVVTLEMHVYSLRGVLFGEGSAGPDSLTQTSLSGMLDGACQRVASLCGDLATIKNKLGCDPMPAIPNNLKR